MTDNLHPTEADGGYCLTCRLRAFFVSGDWWCKNQHADPSTKEAE